MRFGALSSNLRNGMFRVLLTVAAKTASKTAEHRPTDPRPRIDYNPSHKCLESRSLILTVSLLWFLHRSDVCQIDSGLLVCYGRRHVRAFPRADTRIARLPLSRGFGTNPGNSNPLAR